MSLFQKDTISEKTFKKQGGIFIGQEKRKLYTDCPK